MTNVSATGLAAPEKRRHFWQRTGVATYGALVLALGVGALLAPFFATFAASVWVGALLLASGAIGLAMLAVDWKAKGFVWRLLWALIAIVAGLCILIHPWQGAVALTFVLGLSFLAQGFVAIGHAFAHRHHTSCPWPHMAFAGVINIILGALLVWALPHAGLIVPGVFLAFNLITFGASLMAVAFTQPRITP
ncbi:MAG TPA: DUF308 domain-containing protein [Caulobacterales bacterium]|nr:DUF308 domain-containing protein [Caulobacterales bacterium]